MTMTDSSFTSTDSVRNAEPLKYAQVYELPQPLQLEAGGTLEHVAVAYETYGQLTDARDNAILVCHAISGDSHVAAHDEQDTSGWWDLLVGPGKAIDTDRYFVICSNVLGGCRGTTGPSSLNPHTGRPYGPEFPTITLSDMVYVQRELIRSLGIDQLLAVVGGSLGGHQALTWATQYPESLQGCLAIATSPRLTSQALAFDVVARNAILRDPCFHGGQYYDKPTKPEVGLALARMLGHITYLSPESMQHKFDPSRMQPRQLQTAFESKFSVGSYLAYQGDKFVERFDANSYIVLSMAMDLFDLGDTPEKLQATFSEAKCDWLMLSFASDWLFSPEQSQQMVDALIAEGKKVSYCNIDSPCGHDAFLLDDRIELYGGLVESFLHHLLLPEEKPSEELEENAIPVGPTSIFHGQRLDYDLLLDILPKDASILDLGCGSGELLSLLQERGNEQLMGIEIDPERVLACLRKGLSVLQADLNRGLSSFLTGQFDAVVLSKTLQTIEDTEGVLREMLRVGRLAIVSFPNFAQRQMREMLHEGGRCPKAPGLYDYEWYNTPNRRFPSITDFQEFCQTKGIRIEQEIYLDTETNQQVTEDPNLNAHLAIFALRNE
ncbi:Methionine biosynthesis protein MetW [Planctomycetales bacterium 10988]|nr:Methionine biosynthesis protein MetW [Planctomycetales bacterium 10988]